MVAVPGPAATVSQGSRPTTQKAQRQQKPFYADRHRSSSVRRSKVPPVSREQAVTRSDGHFGADATDPERSRLAPADKNRGELACYGQEDAEPKSQRPTAGKDTPLIVAPKVEKHPKPPSNRNVGSPRSVNLLSKSCRITAAHLR